MPDESRVISIDDLLDKLRIAEALTNHTAPRKPELNSITFTLEELRALFCFFHFTGLEAGISRYAWWSGGVQLVGDGTVSLRLAIEGLEEEIKREMGVFYIREGQ